MTGTLSIGIDLGTSGARAVAMGLDFTIKGQGTARLSEFGGDPRDANIWWRAVEAALGRLLEGIERSRVRTIAVDATSGTMLAIDEAGKPLAPPLMYNDRVEDAAMLSRLAPLIPAESAAHGPTSGLAKALALQSSPGVAKLLHQADWIAGHLIGNFSATDENNALKTGYDPVARCWPDWMAETGLDMSLLPRAAVPGTPIGTLSPEIAQRFGLAPGTVVAAGTTDGCASFLATGADQPGEAVSALGSTLTLKLLCERPIFSPQYGIYSHRIGERWLAGGASNSGGRVLEHFFTGEEIARLSGEIDPTAPTGLDYYPLLAPGERFPIMDPDLAPRLVPRPADDARFLQAMLEGIADIEAKGYARLGELGAPALKSVRSVGGGAANRSWTEIRKVRLGVPLLAAQSEEAAAGAARLALAALDEAGIE